ncbi:MAG TPA: hypothetical protein VIW47_13080 [Nitrospiraceae bacterium]|jgi:hypothetical protein
MISYGKEAMDFIRACEALKALLAHDMLVPEDRDIIEYSSIELLSKLKPK